MINLTNANVSEYFLSIAPKIRGVEMPIKVTETTEVTEETYVNYIFRVTTLVNNHAETYYLRQTRDHVKTRPEMKIEPDRIIFEANILDLINEIIPGLVPQVLHLDRKNNIAVLSDIKRGGKLLIGQLVTGKAYPTTGKYFGKVLGIIHGHTLGIENKRVRGGKEENQKAIDFHLGMRLGPAKKTFPELTDKLVKDSERSIKTLVMGDLASKNIFVDGKKIRFLDLERTFVGDPAFDLAFLFCHYLIEIKPEEIKQAVKFIENFMTSYRKEMGNKLSKNDLEGLENRTIRYLGVTILYRLFGFYLVRDLKRDKEEWRSRAELCLRSKEKNVSKFLTEIL